MSHTAGPDAKSAPTWSSFLSSLLNLIHYNILGQLNNQKLLQQDTDRVVIGTVDLNINHTMLTATLGITGVLGIVYAVKRYWSTTNRATNDSKQVAPVTPIKSTVNAISYYDSYLTPYYIDDNTDKDTVTSCSYVQIDIDTSALLHDDKYTISSTHKQLLKRVVKLTKCEVYIGLNINTSVLSLEQINLLLSTFYVELTDIVVQCRKTPLYNYTILLPTHMCSLHEYLTNKLVDLQTIFCPSSDPYQLHTINQLRIQHNLSAVQQHVVNAAIHNTPPNKSVNTNKLQCKRYEQVVIGGTFDHSHSGHKLLLSVAALAATKKLVIGLSADELLKNKKHATVLQSWVYRAQWLQQFVALINPSIECECVELHDMYGPSGDRAELQALVVSAETESGGHKVNEKRAENKIQLLDLFVVKLAKSATASDTDKISSTIIRQYVTEQQKQGTQWIQQQWKQLCDTIYVDNTLIDKYWKLIYDRYVHKPQSELALQHMHNMLHLAVLYRSMLANDTDVLLAIFFHDYMDDTYVTPTNKTTTSSTNNADMFVQFVGECELELDNYHVCSATITAKHSMRLSMTPAQINDMKFYTDIDTSPLSYCTTAYNEYWFNVQNVAVTSDIGITEHQYTFQRQQQIQSLLTQEYIYETEVFRHRFEQKARYNLNNELKRLQS